MSFMFHLTTACCKIHHCPKRSLKVLMAVICSNFPPFFPIQSYGKIICHTNFAQNPIVLPSKWNFFERTERLSIEILWCYHSNETSSKGQNISIDLCSNFLKFYLKKFESFFDFLWPLLGVKSKPGFYMSWKSQTFREFTDSWKLCRLMKSRDGRFPPSSGVVEDKSGQTHLRFVWRAV